MGRINAIRVDPVQRFFDAVDAAAKSVGIDPGSTADFGPGLPS